VRLRDVLDRAPLPFQNGVPLRLIVPGCYSTYWVKMLNDIEVPNTPDENYWMKTAYRIPDTPHASVQYGADQPHGAKLLLHQHHRGHSRHDCRDDQVNREPPERSRRISLHD
jgi:DMSO/TMAO reductase YedYZ molybdopterin-dependent catalytic subunit